ncbi:MAG: hypothetical protein IAF58_19170 [Leptolyngbya sp.]|nr:hypothetical protein [Candidatus Melainabacteria bacterium]
MNRQNRHPSGANRRPESKVQVAVATQVTPARLRTLFLYLSAFALSSWTAQQLLSLL